MAITIRSLAKMKQNGERFACVTAYDAAFAAVLDEAGVEVILVGDSLGMVIQGHDNTLPVTVDDIIYHCRAARRGIGNALLMADLPFMSCASPTDALHNAGRLMKEGGAHMVKLEGGEAILEAVRLLSVHGIPVCGHVGLQPQAVHKLGGYRVQGRDEQEAERIRAEARALAEAGADLVLMECVPSGLAAEITEQLPVPTIGIGAGKGCDAQVLVLQDLLGVTARPPRFAKNFLKGRDSIQAAVAAFVEEVKAGTFPAAEHSFK